MPPPPHGPRRRPRPDRARAEADASAAARADILRQAADEAAAKRAALLDKAREEARKIVEDGQAARARADAARDARLVAQVRDLATAVASRALAAQPPGPEGYADRLTEALADMDSNSRQALLKGGNLTLVSAGDLPGRSWPVCTRPWRRMAPLPTP